MAVHTVVQTAIDAAVAAEAALRTTADTNHAGLGVTAAHGNFTAAEKASVANALDGSILGGDFEVSAGGVISFTLTGIIIGGARVEGTPGNYTPAALGAAAWRYLYLYNNAGTLTIEDSTTAPDGAGVFKTGDVTRRYLGPYRWSGAAAVAGRWNAKAREWTYHDVWSYDVFSAQVNNTAEAAMDFTARVPPTSRTAICYIGPAASLFYHRLASGGTNLFFYGAGQAQHAVPLTAGQLAWAVNSTGVLNWFEVGCRGFRE